MISRTMKTSIISIKGSKASRNDLNNKFDGENALISQSSIKQSKDNNASEDDPIMSIDPNMFDKLVGNLMLNEYVAATSCKQFVMIFNNIDV